VFAPGTHVEAPYFYVCMYEHIRATHAPARLSAWEVGQRSASLLYVDVDLRELGHARVVACGGTRALAGWEVRCSGLLKDSVDINTKGYLTLIEFKENRGIFITSI
jgi:hypothetical protein